MRDMNTKAAETAPLIDVRNLVKSYDDKLVLNGFSLTVQRGETCVIVGASGSGKSTFARLLVGLERPDSGEIRITGVDTVRLGARERDRIRKKFAFVFQQSGLLDSMSVFDNVSFPLREARHLSAADIEKRVHLTLRELHIEDAASKLPGQLSGGMAKRVGIARAVVTEPEILVYDEPTSGIDPVGARVIDGIIERMRVLHGVTSIVISHDMVTAYDVADQVVLLASGKAAAQGPPELLFRSHAAAIEPFAEASGIDLSNLASRSSRVPAAKIRAQWVASHLPSPDSS